MLCALVSILLWAVAQAGDIIPRKVVDNVAPFLGMPELNFPDLSMGDKYKHDFEHIADDGRSVSLKYEVELAQDTHFVHLDRDASVTAVDCSDLFLTPDRGQLTVFFTPQGARALQHTNASQSMVTGSMHWGCRDPEGKATGVLHKIVNSQLDQFDDSNNVHKIILDVERAAYHDVFKHANITFYTNRYPDGFLQVEDHTADTVEEATRKGHYTMKEGSTSESPPQAGEVNNRRRLLRETSSTDSPREAEEATLGWGFSSFASKVWNSVSTVAAVVQSAVVTVRNTVQLITTGNLNYNNTFASSRWAYNMNAQNQIISRSIAIDSFVTCNNCGMVSNFGISFQLVVTNYKLISMRTAAVGDFSGMAGVDGSWSADRNASVNRRMSTTKIPGITFMLGPLPATITMDVLINAGYDLQVRARAVAAASATVFGSFQFGVGYSNGGMYFINEQKFDYTGGLTKLNGAVTCALKIFLLPSVQLQVSYVGGPNVGLEPYVEVNAEAALQRSDPCFSSGGVRLSTTFGLQATVGALLNISALGVTLWAKDFGATAIYSGKWPIFSGCYSLASASTGDADVPLLTFEPSRQTWTGTSSLLSNPRKPTLPMTPQELLALRPQHEQPVYQVSPLPEKVQGSDKLTFSVAAAGVVDVGCAPGTTWKGTMTRGSGTSTTCRLYPTMRDVSIQVIDTVVTAGGPIMDVMLSISDSQSTASNGQTFACVFQQMWTVSVYSQSATMMLAFTRNTVNPQTYSRCSGDTSPGLCSCANSQTTLPSGMYGWTDSNLLTIKLEDTARCSSILLQRVLPGTTGYFYEQMAKALLANTTTPKNGAGTLSNTAQACGFTSGPTTVSPGGCCGGLPANRCSLARGASCDFGCQCVSGTCGATRTCA